MLYFGIEPPNAGREMNAYAMHKESAISGRNSRAMRQSYRPETLNSQQPQQIYKPSTLAGFETSSPITAYPAGGLGGSGSVRSTNAFPSQPSQTNLHMPPQQQISQHNMQSDANSIAGNGAITQDITVTQPTEYPYKAKAIYGYNANPNDANEISFEKHEELEISDVSGRWWQARKANGETGIAPSNYLILL
jgi:SHO1 osmosensor